MSLPEQQLMSLLQLQEVEPEQEPELEPELIAAKLMLLECGMVQCTAAQKGAVQLVAKDVGVISDDSGKPTEDTDTHMVRADRYVM